MKNKDLKFEKVVSKVSRKKSKIPLKKNVGCILFHYGNVEMVKGWCEKCKTYSFVQDGYLVCCEIPFEDKPILKHRESSPEFRRKPLPTAFKNKQLEIQGNKCFYCNRSFGSLIFRKGKDCFLTIHWDHFVPFSFSQDNSTINSVASCCLCNLFKSDLMFESVEDAKDFLLERWKREGFEAIK